MPGKISIRQCLIITAVLISCLRMDSVQAQHTGFMIDPVAREKWKSEAISFLKTASPADFSNEIEFYESNRGYDAVLAFIVPGSAYVRFSEGEWVCIVAHSAHDNASIGDMVLAIDHCGAIYQIDTHVCGGTANFLGFDMFMPANTVEFFAKFKGDKIGCYWKLVSLPIAHKSL